MGRHAAEEQLVPARRPALAGAGLVILVLAAIGLGIWWFALDSRTDPIDAAPVAAQAVVVASPVCSGGSSTTTVDIATAGATPLRATLSGCGYLVGQRLSVQYLATDPHLARIAGTRVAGPPGGRRWLVVAILVIGVVAVATLLLLLTDRWRIRHIATAHRTSVAQLQRALSGMAAPSTNAPGPSTPPSTVAG